MTRRHNRGLLAFALFLGLSFAAVFPGTAQAQDRVWVQIESLDALGAAEQRARTYAQLLDNVVAFRATTGLYAIALGPYDTVTATQELQRLLRQGLVPRDSFVSSGTIFATQFFPIGGTALTDPLATAAATVIEPVDDPEPVATTVVILDETPQEARRSEAQLTRADRDALQIALQWFGFYNAAIDGAFGPGTRRAMQGYQDARGFEATGILTTRQRAQLLDEYQGELAELGMEQVRDERAGIAIDLPLAMVNFSVYNFPFAQFDSVNESGVEVLLISQPGDRSTLFGLYEIMQTLEIVPLQGERTRGRDSFVLTGQSATLRSHTEARLVNGTVKGFTLVWTPERDAQMARVLPMMQSSIEYLGGSLDPAAIPAGAEDNVDLVSGLDVRQPDLVRSGFFVDANGTVLTTTDIAGTCETVLINEVYPASVTYTNDGLGLVVLEPQQSLAPIGFARFADGPGRVRSEIAVSGFPFGGSLNAASMSFGELADLQGINGEENVQRLAVPTAETEAGAPVLDLTGSVLGMVLPGDTSDRALPEDVTLALRGDKLPEVLAEAGITVSSSNSRTAMNRDNLARLGADMTVTVSCWN